MYLEFFFTFFKKFKFSNKIQGYNRDNVSSVIQKILECVMESCHKNTSIVYNISFIFQGRMDLEKSTDS